MASTSHPRSGCIPASSKGLRGWKAPGKPGAGLRLSPTFPGGLRQGEAEDQVCPDDGGQAPRPALLLWGLQAHACQPPGSCLEGAGREERGWGAAAWARVLGYRESGGAGPRRAPGPHRAPVHGPVPCPACSARTRGVTTAQPRKPEEQGGFASSNNGPTCLPRGGARLPALKVDSGPGSLPPYTPQPLLPHQRGYPSAPSRCALGRLRPCPGTGALCARCCTCPQVHQTRWVEVGEGGTAHASGLAKGADCKLGGHVGSKWAGIQCPLLQPPCPHGWVGSMLTCVLMRGAPFLPHFFVTGARKPRATPPPLSPALLHLSGTARGFPGTW